MTGVRVFAADDEYRIALAELTASAVVASDIHDADIVIGSRRSKSRGDQLVLLSAGRGVPIDPPAASVVIDRAWFRTDVAQELVGERGWFPRIEVEVTAPVRELHTVLTDVVAWVRTLADAGLRPGVGAATRAGGIAEARAGDAVVTLQIRQRETGTPVLRVAGIGPRRVEIRIDDDRRTPRVRVADEAGELLLPMRWEDPARVALRRAVEACRSGAVVADFDEYVCDSSIAAQLLQLISEGDDGDRQPRIP
ncbi:hypothetical protein [Microbacterium sp. ZOR0019]|uniref:hypothetical protein n=1 Tax=Microbacterium sp. ZOR0019 TaxID=1339233 RepID=UPI000648BC2F|nr:hypothetical protein [Microbacterium sp. ZOR0019]